MDSVPLLVGNPNQQFLHHLTVNFNVPGFAAWIFQSAGDDIGIRDRRSYVSRWVESYKRAIREERERASIQGNAVVKQSAASLKQRAAVLRQRQRHAHAWRDMGRIG